MRIWALCLVLLLIVPVALAAEKCTPAEQLQKSQLQAKYQFAFYREERHRIGMEAVLAYLKEQGKNISELQDLKEQFVAKTEELQAAAEAGDKDSFMEILKEMKELARDFREGARALTTEEERGQIRAQIQTQLQSQHEHLQGLLASAYNNGKSHMRGKFDAAICVAEQAIERLKNKGYNVSEAEAKLEELKAKADQLDEKFKAAALACADTPYGLCEAEEKAEYEALKTELKGEFKDLRNIIIDIIKSEKPGLKIAKKVTENISEAKKGLKKTGQAMENVSEKVGKAFENASKNVSEKTESKGKGMH